MKRKILQVFGDNPDVSIIHMSEGNAIWGNFDVGQKNQINFIIKAHRDLENDVCVKWKCSCCSEDFCSKNSIVTNLKFINNKGQRVDYLRIGPLCSDQQFYVTAEADFTDIELEQESVKSSMGIIIFELEGGELPNNTTVDEKISIPKIGVKTSDIVECLKKDFQAEDEVCIKSFIKDKKNLTGISLMILASIKDYHIDYILVEELTGLLPGSLLTLLYMMQKNTAVINVDDIKSKKIPFRAASNVVCVFPEASISAKNKIEYIINEQGCEVIKVIFIQENDFTLECLEHIAAEFIL